MAKRQLDDTGRDSLVVRNWYHGNLGWRCRPLSWVDCVRTLGSQLYAVSAKNVSLGNGIDLLKDIEPLA